MDSNVSDIEAAVTARLAPRAIEPEAGEGDSRANKEICANCSIALIGPHCHFCGQKGHVHRSIAAFGHDLLHGVLHFDGKFWRTLPLLIWRPGELTRRYTHGERAKFVSPLAMFLFAVFVMFAVLSIYGVSLSSLDEVRVDAPTVARDGIERARGDVARRLVEARRARATADEEGASRVRELDASIAELESEQAALAQVESFSGVDLMVSSGQLRTGWDRLDKGLEKLDENPGLALYKLQANGYKFSWLLIPLSVPFVWLLFFWTRRFHFYDHTVFVTYSLAFMSLLAVALTLAGFAGAGMPVIGTAAMIIPPIHMYLQLKQAYRLRWFGALIRAFLLANLCFITATLFFVLLLGIGALG